MHAGVPFMGFSGDSVVFFFIVSGFLYRDKGCKWYEYWWRKVKYIFPIYWFTVIVTGAIKYICGLDHCLHPNILPHMFLLQTIFPYVDDYCLALVSPAWFLADLLFCYLAAPTLNKYINNLTKNGCYVIVLVLIVLNMLLLKSEPVLGDYYSWVVYYGPIIRVVQYAMGMALCKTVPTRNAVSDGMIGWVFLLSYLYFLNDGTFGPCPVFLHLSILAYFTLYGAGSINKVLGHKWIVKTVPLSIFIYIAHYPFLHIFETQIDNRISIACLSIMASAALGFIYNMAVNKALLKR